MRLVMVMLALFHFWKGYRYADPMRNAWTQTASAAYSIEILEVVGLIPKGGDDAAEVLRIHYDEIANLEFFSRTISKDFIAQETEDEEGGRKR